MRLEKRVLAPTERELGAALSALARAAARGAALSGAVLEVSVVRGAHPRVALPRALGALARDLYGAGVPVRFAPYGESAPEADVWVGTGGEGGALEAYLLSHPRWRVAGG